ncbi:Hypothetical predicted protein [Pelobates cultripes]|uniref:Uncharacterized protein n=1 Tax=Pelobates cultripes TaxID=61616 RepID=A0AAD1SSE1_PELCU|nr:Hypothetical predicted protein [Pelobates cultripes]
MWHHETEYTSAPGTATSVVHEDVFLDASGEYLYDPQSIRHLGLQNGLYPSILHDSCAVGSAGRWSEKYAGSFGRNTQAGAPRQGNHDPEVRNLVATYRTCTRWDPKTGVKCNLCLEQDKLLDMLSRLSRMLILAAEDFSEGAALDPASLRDWALCCFACWAIGSVTLPQAS